jgi:protein transport protein DSL1/ZW10
MGFLAKRLPEELLQPLCVVMMPDLIPRLKIAWLDSIVPASLKEIDKFQEVLEAVRAFCHSLQSMNYSGFDELQDWVDSAPNVWLTKCRETALDTVRTKLAQGLGSRKEVERVETQTVSKSEGAELAANIPPRSADDDDWGAAWDDGGEGEKDPAHTGQATTAGASSTSNEEDGADAWGWGEDAEANGQPEESSAAPTSKPTAEDDGGDAWGWGDEDSSEQPTREPVPPQTVSSQNTRELTMRETYKISSMPEPVLALISAILEDGAYLVGCVYP